MTNIKTIHWTLAAVITLAAYASSAGETPENDGEHLRFAENRRCVFAGRESLFRMTYNAGDTERRPSQVRGRLRVNRRTVARAQAELKPDENGTLTAELNMAVPSVKAGVVMPAVLEVTIPGKDSSSDTARRERKLYLFHPDPFSSRQEWLKELNIRVFDPAGKTGELFSEVGIPHEVIHNAARMETFEDGFLIIGDGVSLVEHSALVQRAITAAESGARVLCLGFEYGKAVLPGISGTRQMQPQHVALDDGGFVESFDKRFDLWADTAAESEAGDPFSITADNGRITAVFGKEQARSRWPWFKAEYKNGGIFAVSGLPLLELWKESPVPRYLLLEILKS